MRTRAEASLAAILSLWIAAGTSASAHAQQQDEDSAVTVAIRATSYAELFTPEFLEILNETNVPIVLPEELPEQIDVSALKLAWGSASEEGYGISFYYTELGSGAGFAAMYAASVDGVRDSVVNVSEAQLSNGSVGVFRPVSCGGSCAPANIWFGMGGIEYHVQVRLRSTMPEVEQLAVMVDAANAIIAMTEPVP